MKGHLHLKAIFLFAALAFPVMGATHSVVVGNDFFNPRHSVILQGDTVLWNWPTGSRNHNIVCDEPNPNPDPICGNSGAPADGPRSYQFTYNKLGKFPYYCSPHRSSGMTGVVYVVKKNVDVAVRNNSFNPSQVVIAPGEAVTWTWEASNHNVVCEEINDPNCGSTPNAPFATYGSGTKFTHVFNVPGEYNYYCNPHRAIGMTGKVIVLRPPEVTAVQKQNTSFQITINGTANRTNIVEVTTGFEPNVVWTRVFTNVPPQNSFTYTDNNVLTSQKKFYRVLTL